MEAKGLNESRGVLKANGGDGNVDAYGGSAGRISLYSNTEIYEYGAKSLTLEARGGLGFASDGTLEYSSPGTIYCEYGMEQVKTLTVDNGDNSSHMFQYAVITNDQFSVHFDHMELLSGGSVRWSPGTVSPSNGIFSVGSLRSDGSGKWLLCCNQVGILGAEGETKIEETSMDALRHELTHVNNRSEMSDAVSTSIFIGGYSISRRMLILERVNIEVSADSSLYAPESLVLARSVALLYARAIQTEKSATKSSVSVDEVLEKTVDYLQILAILMSSAVYPTSLAQFRQWISASFFNPISMQHAQCLTGFSEFEQELFNMMFPVPLLAITILTQFLVYVAMYPGDIRVGTLRRLGIPLCFRVFELIHTSVASAVLSAVLLYDKPIFDSTRLSLDLSIKAYSRQHMIYLYIAAVVAAVFVFGFPLGLTFYMIRKVRTKRSDEMDQQFSQVFSGIKIAQYGFLWNQVEFFRKVLLSAITIFLNRPVKQFFSITFVSLFSFFLCVILRPYTEKDANVLIIITALGACFSAGLGGIRLSQTDSGAHFGIDVAFAAIQLFVLGFAGIVILRRFPATYRKVVNNLKVCQNVIHRFLRRCKRVYRKCESGLNACFQSCRNAWRQSTTSCKRCCPRPKVLNISETVEASKSKTAPKRYNEAVIAGMVDTTAHFQPQSRFRPPVQRITSRKSENFHLGKQRLGLKGQVHACNLEGSTRKEIMFLGAMESPES